MKIRTKGFTLIELLIVLVIAGIIMTIIVSSFSLLNKSQSLNTETDTILSMIERARARTVSSENDTQYGIHFASTTVTLFVGTTYVSGTSTNETEILNGRVKVKSINLTGGTSDIYFSRLYGKPSATGNVVLSLISNASTTKTVTIYNTGQSDSR